MNFRLNDHSVRMAVVMPLLDVLQELGHDPRGLVADAGINPALFEDPENLIPIWDLGRLLALCATVTGRTDLGLLIATRVSPDALGIVWTLATLERTVGAAMCKLVEAMHHHDRAAVAFTTIVGEQAVLGYGLHLAGIEGTGVISDGALGIGLKAMRALCGTKWRPTEVTLTRRAPRDPSPYEAFFGAPVRFNAAQDSLSFPLRWLRLPVAMSGFYLEVEALRSVLIREAQGKGGFAETVRRQIATYLLSGSITALVVANQLGVSRRTLDWRLAAEGTSFKTLVDDVSFSLARRQLEAGNATPAEIAATLGYSDLSSFSRAFRRWSGVPPQKWRTRHRPGSDS